MDDLDALQRLRPVGQIRRQQLAVAVDDGKQVVEIMGHAAGEPPDRIEPLGVHQGLLQAALFGDIPVVRDHVQRPALGRGDDAEIPRRVDHAAILSPQVALTRIRLARPRGFLPEQDFFDVGFIPMDETMPAAHQRGGGVARDFG